MNGELKVNKSYAVEFIKKKIRLLLHYMRKTSKAFKILSPKRLRIKFKRCNNEKFAGKYTIGVLNFN